MNKWIILIDRVLCQVLDNVHPYSYCIFNFDLYLYFVLVCSIHRICSLVSLFLAGSLLDWYKYSLVVLMHVVSMHKGGAPYSYTVNMTFQFKYNVLWWIQASMEHCVDSVCMRWMSAVLSQTKTHKPSISLYLHFFFSWYPFSITSEHFKNSNFLLYDNQPPMSQQQQLIQVYWRVSLCLHMFTYLRTRATVRRCACVCCWVYCDCAPTLETAESSFLPILSSSIHHLL